jgi:hypothetical protein
MRALREGAATTACMTVAQIWKAIVKDDQKLAKQPVPTAFLALSSMVVNHLGVLIETEEFGIACPRLSLDKCRIRSGCS